MSLRLSYAERVKVIPRRCSDETSSKSSTADVFLSESRQAKQNAADFQASLRSAVGAASLRRVMTFGCERDIRINRRGIGREKMLPFQVTRVHEQFYFRSGFPGPF